MGCACKLTSFDFLSGRDSESTKSKMLKLLIILSVGCVCGVPLQHEAGASLSGRLYLDFVRIFVRLEMVESKMVSLRSWFMFVM